MQENIGLYQMVSHDGELYRLDTSTGSVARAYLVTFDGDYETDDKQVMMWKTITD